MRFFAITILGAVCLTGCSSTSENKKTPGIMSDTMASRFTKPDLTRRSIYEKDMQSSIGKKKGIGSWFTGQKHDAKVFAGGKIFTGGRSFKTGAFASGKGENQMAGLGFSQGDKAPSYGGKSFGTSQSPYGTQAAADGSKEFSGSDAEFETRANRAALKSQQKNVRPKFVEFEDQNRDPAYTEQQVRRLMGRD